MDRKKYREGIDLILSMHMRIISDVLRSSEKCKVLIPISTLLHMRSGIRSTTFLHMMPQRMWVYEGKRRVRCHICQVI